MPSRSRRIVAAVAIAAAAGGVWFVTAGGRRGARPSPDRVSTDSARGANDASRRPVAGPREEATLDADPPPPPFSKSRFRNVGSDARHIGTAACVECHPNNHRSWLLTAHARALEDVDPAAEPPDGSFEHVASGRAYRVYRKDGRLRHEETIRGNDGRVLTTVDQPLRWRVGSGSYSRTYLVEIDGYLTESPVTWYASKRRWDMSPGYDFPDHHGFERPVLDSCMFCHAGRIEQPGESPYRLGFPEKAVGCENCHGPGSIHRDRHRGGGAAKGGEDTTIVHPRRLDRALQEDVCATCHFGAAIMVPVRGRRLTDFRPGLPLSDFRTHYESAADVERMSVTGHVGQMRASACHKKSKMTCLSCHDPHLKERPSDLPAWYRGRCLTCHADSAGDATPGRGTACSLERSERLAKSPTDDCTACHMPRRDTDIPHIAFSDHRIPRRPTAEPAPPAALPNLVPVDESPLLSVADRRRGLALALLEVPLQKETYATFGDAYRKRAVPLLEDARHAGLFDADMLEKWIEITAPLDADRAGAFAREMLGRKDASPHARATALLLLANLAMRARDPKTATPLAEELVRLYPTAPHLRLLGICLLDGGKLDSARAALERSLTLRPQASDVHLVLADILRRQGDATAAAAHVATAEALRSRTPK